MKHPFLNKLMNKTFLSLSSIYSYWRCIWKYFTNNDKGDFCFFMICYFHSKWTNIILDFNISHLFFLGGRITGEICLQTINGDTAHPHGIAFQIKLLYYGKLEKWSYFWGRLTVKGGGGFGQKIVFFCKEKSLKIIWNISKIVEFYWTRLKTKFA